MTISSIAEKRPTNLLLAISLGGLLLAGCSKVEDPSLYPAFDPSDAAAPPAKPSVAASVTRNVFWGDLHIHTSLSFDAYTFGVRTLPDDAYTYMRGGTIEHGMGYAIRALRPLDFGAVTDHAEYLGVARHLNKDDGDNALREVMETGDPFKITWNFLSITLRKMGSPETRAAAFGAEGLEQVSRDAWQLVIDAAERHNEPGVFSSFIAYEWSSMPGEDNLHRNVVYRGSKVPDFPFSSNDSDNPEDLWAALDQQRQQGMHVFAIPHNGNVSNGRMYESQMFNGDALNQDYARQRVLNEPISEILQVKGASETHPILSANDEFADFELYDQKLSASGGLSKPKGSYARDALRTGIEMAHREGFNPFQFGVIGSSDSHNASSSVEENNYHGKLPLVDGSAGLRLGVSHLLPQKHNRAGRWSAMGLAAVWAEENTRESLFDAMSRRETYATSGPRIALRFFAGWDYPEDILAADKVLQQAYDGGVPMGGTLQSVNDNIIGNNDGPTFLVWAAKDPDGANLDRIQIIKGWVDQAGTSHEKIFNIAASDNRQVDSAGLLSAVGNTVKADTATYDNSIGAGQLSVVWRDPEFNSSSDAFYYARAIEIPTPRFSTYDAVLLNAEPLQPVSIQERAISSSIWYQAP